MPENINSNNSYVPPWWAHAYGGNYGGDRRDDRNYGDLAALQAIADLQGQNGNQTVQLSEAIGSAAARTVSDVHAVSREVGDNSRAVLGSVGDNSRAVLGEIADNSRAVLGAICDNGKHLYGAVADANRSVLQTVADSTRSVLQQDSAHTLGLTQRISDEAATTNRTVGDGFTATQQGLYAASRERCENTKDTIREVTDGFRFTNLKQCEDTASIVREIDKTENRLNVRLVEGFKDGVLRSFQSEAALEKSIAESKFELSKQLAECCCEIREKITADGADTRALVNSIERDRQAQLLSDAKAEIQFLRAQTTGPGRS